MGKILHGLGLAVLGYLVIICLLLLANTTIFTQITANRTEVKTILRDSGVYEKVAPALVDSAANQNQNANLPLDDPEVQKIAKKSFDERSLQTNVEAAIDGTYDWLEGKTDKPQFKIDLASTKEDFSSGLSSYLLERTKELPPCTFDQLQQLQSSQDVLALECAPPQIDRSLIAAEVDKALAAQDSLLSEQAITPTDIKDARGEPILDKIKNLPEVFQTAKSLPWLLALVGLAAALGIFFWSESRSHALKRLGIIFISGGLLLLVVPTIIDIYADTVFKNIAADQPLLSELVHPVLEKFNAHGAGIYYGFGMFATLVGAGLLIFRWRINK